MTVPPEHRAFADTVDASKLQDWRPTFDRLSRVTGVPVDDLVHHALVRWVSAGSEALLAIEPEMLRRLDEARAVPPPRGLRWRTQRTLWRTSRIRRHGARPVTHG